ncbi:receptor-like protein kinase [Gossypium australe]|uniref:Receptor-like protein kinase n=1 Tax=Gossypium australe TaxID=47621 RepID=A0A5B6VYH4_9ROSI|nr:receptor-like protein kinase [Gossypium australe]
MCFTCRCCDVINRIPHMWFLREIEIQPDMTYNEEPIRILAREIKELRNKHIVLVKVLWQRHEVEEAMWEPEQAMRKQYPNLFTEKQNTDLDRGKDKVID